MWKWYRFFNSFLPCSVGQEFLHFLQFKANGNLVITTHFFKRSVQLQGNALSIKSAQQMIQDFLEKTLVFFLNFICVFSCCLIVSCFLMLVKIRRFQGYLALAICNHCG